MKIAEKVLGLVSLVILRSLSSVNLGLLSFIVVMELQRP